MVLSVAISGIPTVVFAWICAVWGKTRWRERGYTSARFFRWDFVTVVSCVSFVVSAGFSFYQGMPSAYTAAFSVTLALLCFAVVTDVSDGKVPYELALCAGVVNIILVGGTLLVVRDVTPEIVAGLLSSVTATFLVSIMVMLLFVTSRVIRLLGGHSTMLGAGDVYVLYACVPLAFWSGYTFILIGVVLASVIHVGAVATISGYHRWGRTNTQASVSKLSAHATHTQADSFSSHMGVAKPFLPALASGLVLAMLLFTTPTTVTGEWLNIAL